MNLELRQLFGIENDNKLLNKNINKKRIFIPVKYGD